VKINNFARIAIFLGLIFVFYAQSQTKSYDELVPVLKITENIEQISVDEFLESNVIRRQDGALLPPNAHLKNPRFIIQFKGYLNVKEYLEKNSPDVIWINDDNVNLSPSDMSGYIFTNTLEVYK